MAKTYSGGPVKLHKGLATGKSLKEAEAAAVGKGGKTKGASSAK